MLIITIGTTVFLRDVFLLFLHFLYFFYFLYFFFLFLFFLLFFFCFLLGVFIEFNVDLADAIYNLDCLLMRLIHDIDVNQLGLLLLALNTAYLSSVVE